MPETTGPTLSEIMAALAELGPVLIVGGEEMSWPPCPVCGIRTPPAPNGRIALCYRCTCDELGYTAYDIAVARAHRISLKVWLTYESEVELPGVPYRTWRKRLGR